MKKVIYTCDNDECKKQTNDIKLEGWLEIGSNNGSLFVENNCIDKRLITLGNHTDIHFCSKKCFTDYFFMEEKKD